MYSVIDVMNPYKKIKIPKKLSIKWKPISTEIAMDQISKIINNISLDRFDQLIKCKIIIFYEGIVPVYRKINDVFNFMYDHKTRIWSEGSIDENQYDRFVPSQFLDNLKIISIIT